MPFDPNKPFETIENAGFDPSKPFDQMPQPDAIAVTTTKERPGREIGAGESSFRGGIDMLTGGFGDNIGGAMEALGSLVGIRGIGSPNLKDIRLETDEEDKQSFNDVYEAMRDRRRSLDKSAQEQNPVSYGAGQLAGGVLSVPLGGAVLKGASAAPKLAKGADAARKFFQSGGKMAQAVKAGAAQGGVYGAGASEADTMGGIAFDAQKGAAIGGAGGALFSKGGEVAAKGVKAIGKLISKINPNREAVEIMSAIAFDLPPKYTEGLLRNKNLKNVRSKAEIAEVLVDVSKQAKDDLFKVDEIAKSYLKDTPDIPVDGLKARLKEVLEEADVIGSDFTADKFVKNKLNEIENTLDSFGVDGNISEKALKSIIQKTQRAVKWGDSDYQTSNDLMRKISSRLNGTLKDKNPAYREVMPFVQKALDEEKFVNDTFKLTNKNGDIAPTDDTIRKLQLYFDGKADPKKFYTGKQMEEIDPWLMDEAQMRNILDKSEGGVMSGSRNTLFGTIMGSTFGPVGTAIGATGGYIKDKYGRKVGKEVIDRGRGTINKLDDIFKAQGRGIEKVAAPFASAQRNTAQAAAQSGFTAVTVPDLIADKIGKNQNDFSEQEKRAVTKVYIMKQKNPNMSEDQVDEVIKASVPGYSRKKAAEDFVGDTRSMD